MLDGFTVPRSLHRAQDAARLRRCPLPLLSRRRSRRRSLLAGLNDSPAARRGFGFGSAAIATATATARRRSGRFSIVAGAGIGQDADAGGARRPASSSPAPTRRASSCSRSRARAPRSRWSGASAASCTKRSASPRCSRRRGWRGAAPSTAVGARLLRGVAARIGLDDRVHRRRSRRLRGPDPPAAPAPRPGERRARFPQKGTCLAIYSRAVNARATARRRPRRDVSLVPRPRGRIARSVRRLRRREAGAARPRLTTTCSSGGPRRWPTRSSARRSRALRPRARRRVPGHQPPAGARSCSRLQARTAAASPSSATTRRRSTRSAPPTVRNILDFPAQLRAAGDRR